MKIIAQQAFACALLHIGGGKDEPIEQPLGINASNELFARSKGAAIARQAPADCDEIDYIPGPPTLVVYKDRITGRLHTFKFTFQWRLVEIPNS